VMVFYLKMIILPSIPELGLYHGDIAISRGILDPPATLPAVLFLAGLLALGLWLVRTRPLIGLGILWFFCGHLLESTVFPLEIAHEHRNYLADFGILFSLSTAMASVPYRRVGMIIPATAAALFVIMFSYTTWVRSAQWSDNVQHAVYEAMHHPHAFRAVYVAGRIHARLALAGHEASIPEAFRYLEQADALGKQDIMPLVVMIKLSYLLDRPVDPVWFDRISAKLRTGVVTPSTINSLYELASCMRKECTIPHATMDSMFHLVMQNPGLEQTRDLHAEAATVFGYYTINVKGDFAQGLDLFTRAVELNPRQTQRWINLIKLLIHMGRLEEARQQLAYFRNTDTYNASDQDYRDLRLAIEARQRELRPQDTSDNPGNS